MLYPQSDRVVEIKRQLERFMDEHIYPNEAKFYAQAEELGPWKVYPIVEELKPLAKAQGLWNLFLPDSDKGAGYYKDARVAPSDIAPSLAQILGITMQNLDGKVLPWK